MPKELDVRKIQRIAYALLADFAAARNVDMSVDDLAKLSSIVLEHFIEASARSELKPKKEWTAPENSTCPNCGTHNTRGFQHLTHMDMECAECGVEWIKKNPEVKLEDRVVDATRTCPKCFAQDSWVDDSGVNVGIAPIACCYACQNRWPA